MLRKKYKNILMLIVNEINLINKFNKNKILIKNRLFFKHLINLRVKNSVK